MTTGPHPGRRGATRPGLPSSLVFIGGALGTTARQLLEHSRPSVPGGWPLTTFGINLVGAFLLGLLMESLLRRGPEVGGRHRARLLLGTGFCGGFTTYSTLALETLDRLGPQSAPLLGLGYLAVSLLLGVAAAAAGVALAAAAAPGLPGPARPSAR